MISEKDFDDKVGKLYQTMTRRFAGKKWKSGKRQGATRVPKREMPFDRHNLALWLHRLVGLQAVPCPGCSAPIDILSLTLDHATPVSKGGSLGFENLQPLCGRCNSIKGKMTADEYKLFRQLMAHPDMAFARQDIEARLLSGGRRFRPAVAKSPESPKIGARKANQQPLEYEVF